MYFKTKVSAVVLGFTIKSINVGKWSYFLSMNPYVAHHVMNTHKMYMTSYLRETASMPLQCIAFPIPFRKVFNLWLRIEVYCL